MLFERMIKTDYKTEGKWKVCNAATYRNVQSFVKVSVDALPSQKGHVIDLVDFVKGESHYSPHLTVGELRTTKHYTVLPCGENLRTAFKVHSSSLFQSTEVVMPKIWHYKKRKMYNYVCTDTTQRDNKPEKNIFTGSKRYDCFVPN